MILKSLEIQGFKTFPDRTKLVFGKGITAVVGPNGSGKSNISDAIRWVLGEQSPKALRCSKMEDVVFNGTNNRRPQGYAEVTLTIDNIDRALPYNEDEVAVTRRFYRSGDSDYLINKTSVRLKDIHELFMDTGLGRDGYSMISQGKIDSIVASKSEERREIFDEAAGISRYRYRKAEAEKKLEQTEENLVRLRDIMSELEGRVEPLRLQSEKAKKYIILADEKKGLEIALWLNTLEKSTVIIREQENKISIAKAQYDAVENELEQVQKKTEEIFFKSNDLTSEIENLRTDISTYEENVSKKKSELSVMENNIIHNENDINRINIEIQNSLQSDKELIEEIKQKNKLIDLNIQNIRQKEIEYNSLKNNLDILKSGEEKSSESMQVLNKNLSELNVKLSECKVLSITSSTSIENAQNRLNLLDDTIIAKKSQKSKLMLAVRDYNKMLDDCDSGIIELTNTIKGYEFNRQNKIQKRDEYKSRADKLSLDAEENSRRAKILEDLEKNMEGFSQSVKIVMKETAKGVFSGIHGAVSRVIKVPKEYSVAIEIALGGALQNIVTSTEQDAKAVINYLKKTNSGRATFLPISTISGKSLNESGLEDCIGFIGIASELCSCEQQYNNIKTSLLGRTVIADNIDSAVSIARKYNYRFKVVTLDGQVINTGGSLTGGSFAKKSGLLSRVSEIERFKQESEKLKTESNIVRQQYQEFDNIVTDIESKLVLINKDLQTKQQDKIFISAECKNCNSQIEDIEQIIQSAEIEQKDLNTKLVEFENIKSDSDRLCNEYMLKIMSVEKEISNLTGNKDELMSKKEKLSDKLQNIRLEILSMQKDIEALKNDINSININTKFQKNKREELKLQLQKLFSDNENIKSQISCIRIYIDETTAKIEETQNKIKDTSEIRINIEKQSSVLRQRERDKTAERENISRELARLEERKINLQKDYDGIIGKLWEEYELTKREAENIAASIEDVPQAQRRLAEIKQKIKSLGNVNVSAIDEYKEVSERYEFMKNQIDDIEKSKSELLNLTAELTKQMKDLFVERFNEINKNFNETFIELFGGGKASLSLTDDTNILSSGVEIFVQPPGKIVSHLEALSGGEKALVAISLYFAIMKVRPAPFCVMDEIEAALDDVNIDRFALYLRRMSDKTQFILITHRRGTMEEADVLYGVTMQDSGISKLLELRTSELEQKLGIK